MSGLNRGDRIHMHFYACSPSGNVVGGQRFRERSQSIAVISETAARYAGIKLYREANDVSLSDGIYGVIHRRFTRPIGFLPTYDRLWRNEDRKWELANPIANGGLFGGFDSEEGENARARRTSPDNASI